MKLTVLFGALLAILCILNDGFAQVIVEGSKREDFLASVGNVMNNRERNVIVEPEIKSPFFRKEITQSSQNNNSAPTVVAEPEVQRLSDDVALRIVAKQFNPTGSIVLGGKGYLQLPGGNKMMLGSDFTATIQDETYRVLVSEITPGGYTLQLGNSTLTEYFLTKSAKSQITSGSNTNKTNPPPPTPNP